MNKYKKKKKKNHHSFFTNLHPESFMRFLPGDDQLSDNCANIIYKVEANLHGLLACPETHTQHNLPLVYKGFIFNKFKRMIERNLFEELFMDLQRFFTRFFGVKITGDVS